MNYNNEIMKLLEAIEEINSQVFTLCNAVRELSTEVRTNRDYISKQAELSKKTIETIQFLDKDDNFGNVNDSQTEEIRKFLEEDIDKDSL